MPLASVAAEGPAWALNPSIDSARAVLLLLCCLSAYNTILMLASLILQGSNP